MPQNRQGWRIRREALERFLEQSERSETLVGRLGSFLKVPNNVLSIAQDRQMMHCLDAAFLRVGEAKGGRLIKYLGGEGRCLGGRRYCTRVRSGSLSLGWPSTA